MVSQAHCVGFGAAVIGRYCAHCGEHTEPQVRAAVNAALDGLLPDVTVTLVAPWSKLPTGRHAVLDDPDFELRLLRAHFADDARVRLADEPAETPVETPAAVPHAAETPGALPADASPEAPGGAG